MALGALCALQDIAILFISCDARHSTPIVDFACAPALTLGPFTIHGWLACTCTRLIVGFILLLLFRFRSFFFVLFESLHVGRLNSCERVSVPFYTYVYSAMPMVGWKWRLSGTANILHMGCVCARIACNIATCFGLSNFDCFLFWCVFNNIRPRWTWPEIRPNLRLTNGKLYTLLDRDAFIMHMHVCLWALEKERVYIVSWHSEW